MPVRQVIVRDGITAEARVYLGAPRSRAALRHDPKAIRAIVMDHNRCATFDGLVAELERTCRGTAGVRTRRDHPPPAFGSRAWYAEEILMAMAAVRHALAHNTPQVAAAEAVWLGVLATEAHAKFQWGDVLLRRARRIKNRELSRRSADARRAKTLDQDTALIKARRDYRARHPTHSTRRMAAAIAGPLDSTAGTVRDRLGKLGLR